MPQSAPGKLSIKLSIIRAREVTIPQATSVYLGFRPRLFILPEWIGSTVAALSRAVQIGLSDRTVR